MAQDSAMTQPEPLPSFDDALAETKGYGQPIHVLLGNGCSIAAHDQFDYGTLCEQAQRSLPTDIRQLFDLLGTTNFEHLLRDLDIAIKIAGHYELGPSLQDRNMTTDRTTIKDALAQAIADVHPSNPREIDSKLDNCNTFLKQFKGIFTTIYDLLLYWTSGRPTVIPDGFFAGKARLGKELLLFGDIPHDPNKSQFIYFLHGALHLYKTDGNISKLRWNNQNDKLTQQIHDNLAADIFPMIVTEGNYVRKKELIGANDYLSKCRDALRGIEGNLFILGSSLSDEDTHILDWIANNKGITRVYLGVFGDPSAERNKQMIQRVRAKIEPEDRKSVPERFRLYDSKTAHVWDNPDLEVKDANPTAELRW